MIPESLKSKREAECSRCGTTTEFYLYTAIERAEIILCSNCCIQYMEKEIGHIIDRRYILEFIKTND